MVSPRHHTTIGCQCVSCKMDDAAHPSCCATFKSDSNHVAASESKTGPTIEWIILPGQFGSGNQDKNPSHPEQPNPLESKGVKFD